MEDGSSTHAFPTRHHRPPFHLASPDPAGYPLPQQQHLPDPLDPYARTARVPNAADGDPGSHLDGGGGFVDVWYDREEPWDAGEAYGAGEGFYGRGVRGAYGGYPHCDGKTENAEASVDYCRADSRVSDGYSGRDEDLGSSGGSCEGQLAAGGEADPGPWLSFSPPDGKWRGGGDGPALTSGGFPMGGTYTQKLDSFSEAFLSQRKTKFALVPGGGGGGGPGGPGPLWEFEKCRDGGSVAAGHGWAFDSDSYLRPATSPAHPSLPSFPSPPTSSHLMPSVLSPPPTPLPPPSHSPSKMDSPGASGGAAYSPSPVAEAAGASPFFPSRPPAAGTKWKFPMVPHCFPQASEEPGGLEGGIRAAHGGDYHNFPASHDLLQPPESLFLTSTSYEPCFKPYRAASNAPSLHSHRPHRRGGPGPESAAPLVGIKMEQDVKPEEVEEPRPQKQPLIYSGVQFSSVLQLGRGKRRGHYTPRPLLNPSRKGTGLFSSISAAVLTRGNAEPEACSHTPRVNIGADFQVALPPCFEAGEVSAGWPLEEESPREQLLWKPFGDLEESLNSQDQVEKLLLLCSSSCLPGGGSNTELALHCLHRCEGRTMATLEMLLLRRPSPAGDYHYSGSDVWTDSERSLFTDALRTCGKDFSLIQKTVSTKTVHQCVEFYYLSKKLQDKQKKQKEEEMREEEVEQQQQQQQQRKSATPICQPVDRPFLEEAVPAPSLASFFPCKLCGKMFYKIKSRNAHMKIHRQPQEDWADRRLQHQLLTQRLALSRPANLLPTTPGNHLLQPPPAALTFPGLGGTAGNAESNVLHPGALAAYSNLGAPNSHVNAGVDVGEAKQREPGAILPFHQSWGSFGHSPDPLYPPEGKEGADVRGMKEPINWQ